MDKGTHQATPFYLQECIAADLREMLEGARYRNPDESGDDYVAMQVFEQALPIPQASGQEPGGAAIDYDDSMFTDPVYNCPWTVVKLDSGEIPGPNAKQKVVAAICFGLYNPDPANDGHKEILNLIQEVYARFSNRPILAKNFRCLLDFEWSIQREDTFPYFFGAISMSFEMHGVRQENEFT